MVHRDAFAGENPQWSTNLEFLRSLQKPRAIRVTARRFDPSSAISPTEKIVHFVRHGQGYHNLAAAQPGVACHCATGDSAKLCPYLDPALTDARLTEAGEEEARAAKVQVGDRPIQLVVVSPLTRTLQTASLAFLPQAPTPFLAHEAIREHLGVHVVNKRSRLSLLATQFPHVDFSLLTSPDADDGFSASVRESRQEMADRAYPIFECLKERAETEIAVVSHASLLLTIFNSVMDVEEEALRSIFRTAEVRSVVVNFS
uniref:Phosphoglycerate mutase family protein n=1 Tax=Compsopogon caeruleus TaxID=31354 RepID=A0A7S1THA7_9RHOD|mmetsp:Transcript_6519/g.13109  ORF Transcript_6519/g.13109 Transcript_6519/m.13109 type:complete len:258 (+) Transcript_6519:33-806(+)